MNQRLQIFFPGKLIFGSGSLDQLADEVLQLKPSRVFIATIAPLQKAITPFITALENNQVQILTDTSIVQEPTFADFELLMQTITPFNPDVVMGIGGVACWILPSW
jgi:alcohol dehydrogenase class IV